MNRSRQEGSILIIVLILMTIAVSLALYMTAVSREIVRSSQMIMDKLQAKLEADSLSEKLKYIIATGKFDSWFVANLSGNHDLPVILNLRGDPIKAGNSEIKLIDGASRMGLWPPAPILLGNILKNGGVKASSIATVTDCLIDWIDEDDLKRLNGAEKYYYQFEQGYKFVPRNDRYIQSVEELKLIKGFDKEIYERVKGEIIETSSGTININTADATVLSAVLGITRESADQIVQLREKIGFVAYGDIARISGKGLTFQDEYITNHTSLIVAMEISCRIGEARENIHSVINFRPALQNPYTVEKFNN